MGPERQTLLPHVKARNDEVIRPENKEFDLVTLYYVTTAAFLCC